MSTTYGQLIRWTDFHGRVTSIEVRGCATPEEAKGAALKGAIEFGWTPPLWWQWWRRGDTKLHERSAP